MVLRPGNRRSGGRGWGKPRESLDTPEVQSGGLKRAKKAPRQGGRGGGHDCRCWRPSPGGKGDPPSSELVRPSGNLTLEGEIPRGLRKWLLGGGCSVGRRELSGGLACPEQTNWPQPLAPSAQHVLSAGAASGTASWPPACSLAGEGAASAPTQAAGWQSLSTFPCQPVTGASYLTALGLVSTLKWACCFQRS